MSELSERSLEDFLYKARESQKRQSGPIMVIWTFCLSLSVVVALELARFQWTFTICFLKHLTQASSFDTDVCLIVHVLTALWEDKMYTFRGQFCPVLYREWKLWLTQVAKYVFLEPIDLAIQTSLCFVSIEPTKLCKGGRARDSSRKMPQKKKENHLDISLL